METIKDYDKRISFKERRITASLNISDYKACDELKDAVMELKKKRRELEAEMKRIAVANRQSRWYFRKKSGEETANTSKSGSSSTSSEPLSPLAYESSSDTNESTSMIGSEGSLVLSESPISLKPQAVSLSPVFGTSSKGRPMLKSTQKRSPQQNRCEPAGLKPGECSKVSVARSSISSSPQSPDTCVVLTQKSTDSEMLASQPESPDCTKKSDELDDCIVLSESEIALSQLQRSHSPELDISLIESSDSSPPNASSQFPLFSQPEPAQVHNSDSSDSLPFSPSLPAAQQQV